MSTLHEVGPPEISFGNIMKRTMSSFIVLTAFFLLVFNLIMEWLVLAVHSPLVILAIFLYLFVIIKHKEKFDPEKMLFRLAEVGEGFFAKFIKMFHYRQTFALGIAGILVMHLITDLSVFILPYLFSFKENIYLHLGAGHTPIASLMLADFFAAKSVLGKIAINYNYIMNVIAIILLLLGPVFIWFVVYKRQGFTIKNYAFAIFYAALSCFFMSPAFEISHFSNKGIAGVDIITRSIFTNNNTAIMIISLVVGLFAYYLAKRHKRELFIVASVLIQVFFAVYVFHFFISIAQYYLNSVLALLYLKEFFFFFYFLLFFIISLLFYIGGFIIFIHECWVK